MKIQKWYKVTFLITFFSFTILNSAKAQDPTITITPTTLNLGNIEVTATTDETHYFDVTIGADAGPTTIYVEVYRDDGSYSYSPSFEVSVDNKASWGVSKTFTPNIAGETRTIYVRCSPLANNTDNSQSEIWVFATTNSDYIDQAYVTLAFPEMDLYGGSSVVAIADNDATPSLSDSTDFGNVAIGGTREFTYTIKNTKGGPPGIVKGRLFLTDIGSGNYITIGGTDASMFTVTQQPTSPIAYSNGSTTFKVLFTPTSSGTKSATISIGNNDTDENPYNFSIQGTGLASLPVLTTTAISLITSSTASGGGDISSDGGASVTARGICWSTSLNPTTASSYSTDGAGTGSYSSSLSSLIPGTHYYVRAYATNTSGTNYGSNKEFWALSIEPTTQASSLTVSNKTATTVDLSWSASSGATGYIILGKTGSTAPTSTGVSDGMAYASFTGIPAGTSVLCETASTTCQVTGLSASTQYSFTVISFAKGSDDATYNYKIDGTLTTVTVTTVAGAPTVQASGIKFGTSGSNQMEISWTAGNGDGQIVVMKANSATSSPSNGSSYTGNTTFGSGDDLGDGTFVVFRGSSAKGNIVVSNVSPGTVYYIKILEYSGVGTQTSYNMTETSGWNSGNTAASSLPIELLSFTATLQSDESVLLNWSTASEVNNDYFTIERSSDLINWKSVLTVKGSGTSSILNEYSAIDILPISGITYYRLKQTDFDGKYTFSDVLFIENNSSNNIEISNPFISDNQLKSIIFNQAGVELKAEIISIEGKIIYSKQLNPESDVFVFSVSQVNLPKGIFLLRISSDNESTIKKFIN